MFTKIDHIEIVAKNLHKMSAFYIQSLGFVEVSRDKLTSAKFKEAIMLAHNEIRIELLSTHADYQPAITEKTFGLHLPAFEVQDMVKTLNMLKHRGIAAAWGPKRLGNSIRAEIFDIEGNSIELRQWYSVSELKMISKNYIKG